MLTSLVRLADDTSHAKLILATVRYGFNIPQPHPAHAARRALQCTFFFSFCKFSHFEEKTNGA